MQNNIQDDQDVYKVYVLVMFSKYFCGSPTEVKQRLSDIHVTKLSTADTINVTTYPKEPSSYIVAFNAGDVIDVDPSVLVSNIISIFRSNLPGATINFTMGVIPLDMSGSAQSSVPSMTEAKYMLTLHNIFATILENSEGFNYSMSNMIEELFDAYSNTAVMMREHIKRRQEESMEDSDDDIRSPLLNMAIGSSLGNLPFDLDDSGSGKKKKNKKKKHYRVSRVIKEAKSPKKAYKRHGIIICKEKDAIKRDRKIIKEFLKDFIPGNSKWKKDFRDDLLDRWMHVYVMTGKQLKRIEKNYRKSAVHDRRAQQITKTLDMTRKLFNVPVDRWNDPSL